MDFSVVDQNDEMNDITVDNIDTYELDRTSQPQLTSSIADFLS